MRKNIYGVVLLISSMYLAGCAGGRALIPGSQKIVENFPKKAPEWKDRPSWDDEKASIFYFTGRVNGRSDMALGIEEARAESEKQIAYRIGQKIYAAFGRATEGQNIDDQLGGYVKSTITKASENIKVSGSTLKDQFVEKVETTTELGVKYSYNCYALVTLSREDYQEAKRRALEGAIKQAQEAKNAKAELSLKEAEKKLDEIQ